MSRARRWAALALLGLCVGAGPAIARPEHDYVGVDKCGTCHEKSLIGNQVAVWRKDPHARAYETLTSDRSAAIARERGLAVPASQADECLRCHVTAHGVPAERVAYPIVIADGVQCESCHGPGRDYRKKSIMSNEGEAFTKGLWDAGKDSGICQKCHNQQSPTFDPARYRLADGSTVGFDFEQAKQRILHEIPPDVKGKVVEIEKKRKEEARRARAAGG